MATPNPFDEFGPSAPNAAANAQPANPFDEFDHAAIVVPPSKEVSAVPPLPPRATRPQPTISTTWRVAFYVVVLDWLEWCLTWPATSRVWSLGVMTPPLMAWAPTGPTCPSLGRRMQRATG